MTARSLPLGLVLLLSACGGTTPGEPTPAAPPPAEERLPGGATTNTLLGGSNAFTMPAANITAAHEELFFAGNGFFNQAWVQAPSSTEGRDGLGPLFNARSCAACHFKDGRGRPPLADGEAFLGMLLRIGPPELGEHGAPAPDPNYGGQLQPFSVLGVPAEGTPRVTYTEVQGEYADGKPYGLLVPEYAIAELAYGPLDPALRISPRVAPAMIGLGLLEAIPEARLLELADPEDADENGTSGRINRVWDVVAGEMAVGRFGWKAEQPTVRQQSAGAFLGDMGLTTELFGEQDCTASEPACIEATSGGAPEVSPRLLERVAVYALLVAVPARTGATEPDVLRGRELFTDIGCASCHVPRHETGEIEGFPELSGQIVFPYTDLLLHDLGEELSDGRPSFGAEGNEWRTPPLWGIGRYPVVNGHDRLLHDGRARGVAEAILWHGGEAEEARERFRTLPQADRASLVVFVESL
jgi:CxxC motif-containing protein (DUF1111 family)